MENNLAKVLRNFTSKNQIEKRATITALNDLVGSKVNRPMPEQRPAILIEELGIKYIDNLVSNFVYPCINGQTSEWQNETAQGNVTNTSFASVKLTPRRLLSYCEYSRMVDVLNPDSEFAASVQEDLNNSVWDKVQSTMFNDIYDGTNASVITDYDDIVAFELAAGNKKINNGVYMVSPTAASKLKKVLNGQMPAYFNGMLNGFRVIETPFLTGEKIIFGDFTRLLLGQFNDFNAVVDDKTQMNRGAIAVTINSFWDWSIIDEDAFVFATTATE